jgi:hypothetical protein
MQAVLPSRPESKGIKRVRSKGSDQKGQIKRVRSKGSDQKGQIKRVRAIDFDVAPVGRA